MSEPVVRSRAAGLVCALAWIAGVPAGASAFPARDIFPFEARVVDLDNGLRVAAVPLGEPDTVVYCTIVRAGVRNEVEARKTGLAAFLERLILRGPAEPAGDDALLRIGAEIGGFGTEDFACRSVLFAGRENLETVIRAEADRLAGARDLETGLRAETPILETETGIRAASPSGKLLEILKGMAFERHPYRRFPGGFELASEAPASRLASARQFRDSFYAPGNTIIFVAGDIVPERLAALVKKHYGAWEGPVMDFRPAIEPPQTAPKRLHIEWPSAAIARLAIAFHGPAFSDANGDKAALDILAALSFSPASPLYRRLVFRERKCLSLGAVFPDTLDPSLLVLTAAAGDEDDLPAVEAAILDEIGRLKREDATPSALAAAVAHLRAAMTERLSTAQGTARTLASFIGLTGDPASLNRLFVLYDRTRPSDIRRAARTYLAPENSTTVTLAAGAAK